MEYGTISSATKASTAAIVVAFFGATGDCAGYCLAAALHDDYNCRVLVRSPAKLTESMTAKGVSQETMDRNLTVISGDIRNTDAVKKVLQVGNGRVVDKIISGIGGSPKLQWSLAHPVTLNDPRICQDGGASILDALHQLQTDNKPLLVNVSTTGIKTYEGQPCDVPVAFIPFYHWFLSVPHKDKKVLEDNLAAHMQLPEDERVLEAYVNVRPSLLQDGKGKGWERVREGSEEKPAVGYFIHREDVGRWMFEKLVKSGVELKGKWKNAGVTITT
ncbi:hypothetical protein M433DRAFT_84451 [Acidomyces richmondensis BFW]|nr:MAG: hypothetical protein FE78DRAFT_36207 [Acidomyces sp. 'richmondensis']KYG48153.1 hypothetical protein M433DRAFT_84451 [Acidomyces richmondensis BFW]